MISKDEKKQDDMPLPGVQEKMAVGQRLRRAREARQMTPHQLATLICVPTAILAKIEQGKQRLSIARLLQVSDILGTNPHWLATGVTPVTDEELRTNEAIRRAVEKKCRAYDELAILMQVPEVAEMINSQLKNSKLIFKDRINEARKQGRIK